jgi:hypothetical protein
MSCFNFIKDVIFRFQVKKTKEQKRILKDRILRFFQDGQRNAHFSFTRRWSELIKDNLFAAKELDIAKDAIEELVSEGFLEYDSGNYYLKGRAPKW